MSAIKKRAQKRNALIHKARREEAGRQSDALARAIADLGRGDFLGATANFYGATHAGSYRQGGSDLWAQEGAELLRQAHAARGLSEEQWVSLGSMMARVATSYVGERAIHSLRSDTMISLGSAEGRELLGSALARSASGFVEPLERAIGISFALRVGEELAQNLMSDLRAGGLAPSARKHLLALSARLRAKAEAQALGDAIKAQPSLPDSPAERTAPKAL